MRKQTISSDTIARTIVLVLALVNQILAIEGKSAISFANKPAALCRGRAVLYAHGCRHRSGYALGLVEKQQLHLSCL